MFNRGTSRAEEAPRCCVVLWTHCRSMGGESAWLKVNAENIRAIGFYLRHGFNKIGCTDFVIADKAYENHVMKTDLRHPVD